MTQIPILLLLVTALAACSEAPQPSHADVKKGLAAATLNAPAPPVSAPSGRAQATVALPTSAGKKAENPPEGTAEPVSSGGVPTGGSAPTSARSMEIIRTKALPEGWYEVEVRQGAGVGAKTVRLLMRQEDGRWVTQAAAENPAAAAPVRADADARTAKKGSFELRFETKTGK